jgi:hypothetical protein
MLVLLMREITEICSGNENLLGEKHIQTQKQQSDLMKLHLFFQNKVSRLRTFSSAETNDSFKIFQNVCFKRVFHIYV